MYIDYSGTTDPVRQGLNDQGLILAVLERDHEDAEQYLAVGADPNTRSAERSRHVLELARRTCDGHMIAILADAGAGIATDSWRACIAGAKGDAGQVKTIAGAQPDLVEQGAVGAAGAGHAGTVATLARHAIQIGAEPGRVDTVACAAAIINRDPTTLMRLLHTTSPDLEMEVTPDPGHRQGAMLADLARAGGNELALRQLDTLKAEALQ